MPTAVGLGEGYFTTRKNTASDTILEMRRWHAPDVVVDSYTFTGIDPDTFFFKGVDNGYGNFYIVHSDSDTLDTFILNEITHTGSTLTVNVVATLATTHTGDGKLFLNSGGDQLGFWQGQYLTLLSTVDGSLDYDIDLDAYVPDGWINGVNGVLNSRVCGLLSSSRIVVENTATSVKGIQLIDGTDGDLLSTLANEFDTGGHFEFEPPLKWHVSGDGLTCAQEVYPDNDHGTSGPLNVNIYNLTAVSNVLSLGTPTLVNTGWKNGSENGNQRLKNTAVSDGKIGILPEGTYGSAPIRFHVINPETGFSTRSKKSALLTTMQNRNLIFATPTRLVVSNSDGSAYRWSAWSIDEVPAPEPTTIFAPQNAATVLRTLRELGNRDWNIWFTTDGTQGSVDLAPKSAYNDYFLGLDMSEMSYDYNRRMQMLLFSAATDTWRTDLNDPTVRTDLGVPTYSPGPWQAVYDISNANSVRISEPLHPDEYTRMVSAITAKSPGLTTNRVIVAAIIDGSSSYYEDSGFAAWEADDAEVPGIVAVLKQTVDALVALGRGVDVLVVKCSGYDTQDPTTVYDFDGTEIAVGGDLHRYGDDEDDFISISPSLTTAIPAVTVLEIVEAVDPFDTTALKTAWFAAVTEPDNDLNDMAETMLEGMRHAIGYATLNGLTPVEYESKHMIVGTDAVMKFPVDQYFDGYPWPDLPIVTESFGPIDIDVEFTGTLWLDPRRYLESDDLDVDVELSGWLIPIFQEPIEGAI